MTDAIQVRLVGAISSHLTTTTKIESFFVFISKSKLIRRLELQITSDASIMFPFVTCSTVFFFFGGSG